MQLNGGRAALSNPLAQEDDVDEEEAGNWISSTADAAVEEGEIGSFNSLFV